MWLAKNTEAVGGRGGGGDGRDSLGGEGRWVGELMRTIMMKMVTVVVVGGGGVAARVRPFCCVNVVSASLHVPTDGLDVVAGEHASMAVAASFPPVGVGIIQDLDEFAALETELPFLLWVEVEESLHVCGVLGDLEEEKRKEKKKKTGTSSVNME